MRTLGQERSEFALNEVLNNKKSDRLKPLSAGAPSMILKNGFGQTLAFWKSKEKEKDEYNEYKCLFNILKTWLIQKEFAEGNTPEDFLKSLSTMDQKKYLIAQKETLDLLEWVKRYAGAFIKEKKED